MQTETLLKPAEVKARLGRISDMTLWRWERDPRLNFPQPVRIRNRKYFRQSEIEEFEQALYDAIVEGAAQ